jgi:hypothetical protein
MTVVPEDREDKKKNSSTTLTKEEETRRNEGNGAGSRKGTASIAEGNRIEIGEKTTPQIAGFN